jgi:UrcA family protein
VREAALRRLRQELTDRPGTQFGHFGNFKEMNMNTMHSSGKLCSLAAIAGFAAVAASFSGVAAAGNPELLQITVPYADLTVSSPRDAATLYNRIRIAAQAVCWPLDHGDLSSKRQMANCTHKAIADAVTNVGQPALFAVYGAKNGQPLPNIVAAERR